jgi:hypothetical protein
MDTTIEYLNALYHTLREMKGLCYQPEKYKWRLGVKVLRDIDLRAFNAFTNKIEPLYLYGIVVEVDYTNPNNVQLFEDITNKIYIDKGVDNDTSREKN